MNHMLAQEQMGIFNAFEAGLTRDDATFQAALTAIGSSPMILLLPFDGDGLWTLNNAHTVPSNITLLMPPGVTRTGTGLLTMNGQLVSYNLDWNGGAPLNYNFAVTTIGALQVQRLGVSHGNPQAGIHLNQGTGTIAAIRIDTPGPITPAAYQIFSGGTLRMNLGLLGPGVGPVPVGDDHIRMHLQTGTHFYWTGGNVGIGMLPTVQLELSGAVAQKSSGTTWANPSDMVLKKDIRPFQEGLDTILALNPVYYKHNGLAGLPLDDIEHISLVAQEAQPIAPYLIGSYATKLHPEDLEPTPLLTYDGSALPMVIVNAIKEQQMALTASEYRCEQLEARCAALEIRLTALESAWRTSPNTRGNG